MSIFTRAVLQKAFPDDPRAVAAFERLDDLLTSVDENGQTLTDKLDKLLALAGADGGNQKQSPVLDSIAALPNRVGALEIAEGGVASIRPIDGQDPASLLSRGVGYTVFVGIAGRGPTASRPALPEGAGGIYFDTDLDPDGQPMFWTGLTWVDANGVPG